MSDDSKEIIPLENETKKNLSATQKLITFISDLVTSNEKIPYSERLTKLTQEQKNQLQEIEDKAIMGFIGTLDELEAALGMLRIGHHFGWKVLYLIHSKRTIRKYEDILGIKIRDLFPERGASANRSIGLALAETYSNFWKVVSGEIKITHRRDVK